MGEGIKYCRQCGKQLNIDAKFCRFCGYQFEAVQEVKAVINPCPQCGKDNAIDAKFCRFCGSRIPKDAVVCTKCGRQVEKLERTESVRPVIINNTNSAPLGANRSFVPLKKPLNKWTSFFLCLFLGVIGAHKFYEGKIGMGVLYFFTGGLFGIGALVDLIVLLAKPNPYYV